MKVFQGVMPPEQLLLVPMTVVFPLIGLSQFKAMGVWEVMRLLCGSFFTTDHLPFCSLTRTMLPPTEYISLSTCSCVRCALGSSYWRALKSDTKRGFTYSWFTQSRPSFGLSSSNGIKQVKSLLKPKVSLSDMASPHLTTV